jgi:hypothetical protein
MILKVQFVYTPVRATGSSLRETLREQVTGRYMSSPSVQNLRKARARLSLLIYYGFRVI